MADGIQIERSKHAQEFVIIGNSEARDHRLSFRARGLHHHLLSLPPGWRVTTVQLAADNPEGRDAIRSALNELIACGYVTKVKQQDGRGRWSTVMTVHDKPQPGTGFQAPVTEDGFPGVGNPGVGKPGAKELKTVTENDKDQKMAPRRAAHSVRGSETDISLVVDDVRRAAVRIHGDRATRLTDEQCTHIYRRFCCTKTGRPYQLAAGVYAYLVGGPLKDVPTLEQALQPSAKRRIPMAALRRFNDPNTADDELVEIVESVTGTLEPGEEPAVQNMIMDGRPLEYIVNVVSTGQLNVAS